MVNFMLAIDEKDFIKLVNYIKKYYGIDLSKKKGLVEGRLSNMVYEKGFCNFSSYLEYVFSNPKGDEPKKIISKLTTNHTYFMREPSLFKHFKDEVLPYLDKSLKEQDLRIWSAGCSTGQEPYTLAMMLDEYFGYRKADWDAKILATDISVPVLEKAKNGIYTKEELKDIPKLWMLNYFDAIEKDKYQVNNHIRKEIIFRGFNLMEEVFPFKKKFHVIFCRNVMIYFDNETKKNLIDKFYQFMEPGGYLFVGLSESLNRNDTSYKYIMPSIYRKG